jgi:drug/metabolite transporter (DMT)-like permease
MTTWSRRPSLLPDVLGAAGSSVILLGLISALAWGAGDFGGGTLARRAPLLGVVLGTQLVGLVLALVIGLGRGERFPQGADLGWAIAAGVAGVIGISSLYRGLAVGRMGVVAPTTGVLAAVIPVVVGFVTEGIPDRMVVVGIVVALIAVVLVTRAPGHVDDDRPSGIVWALLGGTMIGLFNVCVGQFSGDGALLPLVVVRLVQSLLLVAAIVLLRQPWRMSTDLLPKLVIVGVLDMVGNAAFILAAQTGQLAIAAVLSSLYPVTTVILAIAILRERVTRSHLVGIALTALAIVLIGVGSATL